MKDVFIDEATVHVVAGRGGDGAKTFRREKFVPFGGPDGGDGGNGGSVVFEADRNLATLVDQRMRRKNKARPGDKGGGTNKTGKRGEDLVIRLPVGTLIFDAESGDDATPIADLTEDGQRFVIARGGKGGRGNTRFATSTHQVPEEFEEGLPGQALEVRLSLKLLADAGLVGFPNAGKSTLLRRISSAKPRVAAYPFTTLIPNLGVAEVGERRFVVADIPGLIEGASDGLGLGDRFLRHIERTRVLIHVIDVGTLLFEEKDPIEAYDAIRAELAAYEPSLLERHEVVALNKVDLVADREAFDAVRGALEARGRSVYIVSGATGEGIETLLEAVAQVIDENETTA